jgi:hypothetical protein
MNAPASLSVHPAVATVEVTETDAVRRPFRFSEFVRACGLRGEPVLRHALAAQNIGQRQLRFLLWAQPSSRPKPVGAERSEAP